MLKTIIAALIFASATSAFVSTAYAGPRASAGPTGQIETPSSPMAVRAIRQQEAASC